MYLRGAEKWSGVGAAANEAEVVGLGRKSQRRVRGKRKRQIATT